MNVLVIDDHPLVSEALRNVLTTMERDVQVFEAASGEEGMEAAREHPDLDLVVLDLILPGVNGMTILDELRREFIALPVLVLSASSERATVERAIRRGASGFITKSTPKAGMADAIRKVLAGEIFVPAETMLGRNPQPSSDDEEPAPVGSASWRTDVNTQRLNDLQRRNARRLGLTIRETEVLERLLSGDSNKTIAEALGLAESTIKAHCSTIFRLLKVASRSQVMSRVHEGMLDA